MPGPGKVGVKIVVTTAGGGTWRRRVGTSGAVTEECSGVCRGFTPQVYWMLTWINAALMKEKHVKMTPL